MITSSRIVALLLLAFWLPAVAHCDLESVGVLGSLPEEAAECCLQTPWEESLSNCTIIEESSPRVSEHIVIPAPALSTLPSECLLALLLAAQETAEQEILPHETVDRLPGWIPEWQFVQRAAPAPRAPSLIVA